MSNSKLSILISGASIAGPALAYWLSRYGFQSTIVEYAPTFRTGGYKVDIRGVAVKVADRMGIVEAVRQASTNMQGATFVDSKNKPIATLSSDLFGGRVEGDDEILRGDLAQILYERTCDTTEYLFGDAITAIDERDNGVEVTFKHNQSRHFDLVIGADGLHSNVRKLVFGAEEQYMRHLDGYLTFFSFPNFLQLDHQELCYAQPGLASSVYSMQKDAEAKCVLFFSSPPLDYDYRNNAQQKQIINDRFANAGWLLPQLLTYAQSAADFYFDAISIVQMDHWSKGRTVLLGDAAYCASPVSGQGTGLALVGAYTLAGELAVAHGDHRLAFARYESAMRGYVDANQQFALKSINTMIPQSRVQLWLMTQMMRMLPYLPWKGFVSGKILEEVQRSANAMVLKDYQPLPIASSHS